MKFNVLIFVIILSCSKQKINLDELSGYWEIDFIKKITKNTFLNLQFYNTIIILLIIIKAL